MTENKAVYIVSGQLLDALDADKEATIASLRTDIEILKAQLNQARQVSPGRGPGRRIPDAAGPAPGSDALRLVVSARTHKGQAAAVAPGSG